MSDHTKSVQHGDPSRFDGNEPDFDEPTGPPYRAIAMVLLAAVVLAIGIGLVQLFGGDESDSAAEGPESAQVDDATAPGDSGQPGQAGPAGQENGAPDEEGTAPRPDESDEEQLPSEDRLPPPAAGADDVPDVTSVPVQVYNNSNVTGLAGRTGEELRENGFAVGDVDNLPSNRGVVGETTVYFGEAPGEQQAAEAIATQLGVPAVPRPADLAPGAQGVIVIVTQDLDR